MKIWEMTPQNMLDAVIRRYGIDGEKTIWFKKRILLRNRKELQKDFRLIMR